MVYHIKDTNYDHEEEGAIVPNHVLEGEGLTVGQDIDVVRRDANVERKRSEEVKMH
jgi:hypothetical protein